MNNIPVTLTRNRTHNMGKQSVMVREFTSDLAEEWDRYVLASQSGSFCHLIGWKNVIEKTFGYRSFYACAHGDGKICGILPLFLVKSFLFGSFLVSTPFAAYGGICADDIETEALLLAYAKEIASAHNVDYVELRNIEAKYPELPKSELYVTFLQELHREDEEKNWKLLPRETRRLIRKAKQVGLSAVVDRSNLDQFYNIYSRSVRDLGTPVFPISLFQNFMDEFPEDCNILKVYHEDKIIAAVLVFYFRDRVMPYYAGALKEYNNNRHSPNNFMYWELIRYGIENDYGIFDFGRSKVGTGTYNFKRHFGMNPMTLNYQYFLYKSKELPNLNPLNPKFQLPIRLWKKLPLRCANAIGPAIVKYLP